MPRLDRAGRARTVLLALGLLSGAGSSVAAQLSVDELEVFLRPGSGAGATGMVRVTNDADHVVQAFIEIGDWDRDEAGSNRFHPGGTLKESCRERLSVFPMTLRLEPGSSESIRITLAGSDSLAACWGIVFVQSSQTRQQPGSGITYVVRTGIKVYAERAAAWRDATIEDVRLSASRVASESTRDSATVRAIEVAFRNTGEAHLRTSGSLELRRPDNSVAARLEIPEFPSVPGALRRLTLELPPGTATGEYVALVLLDYGGQEIAAGQIEIRIR